MLRKPEDRQADSWDAALGWTFTAVALTPTVAFFLAASMRPALLGQSVAASFPCSLGLVLGLGLVVYLVVLALLYTRWLNGRERRLARLRSERGPP